jgi:Uncharacterised nucleotidyltransferase
MLSLVLRRDVEGVRARGGPDWAAVAALAQRHGLGALLHHRMGPVAREWPLPPTVERSLRTYFLMERVDSAPLMAGAAAALERLNAAGVRVAALKGLHLAAAVYEHPALRPMNDVDLLVPADQLSPARAALLEAGYRSEKPDDPTLHHVAPLVKPRCAPLELHVGLCPTPHPFRLDVAPFWRRAVPIHVGAQPALGLCAEDLLLHLCVHSAYNHHCLVPLRNVFDIVMVLERHGAELRWDRLEETAHATGTHRSVFCGLALARDMFAAAVPAEVLERLVPGEEPSAVLRTARENVLSFDAAGPTWLGITLGETRPARGVRGLLGRVFAPRGRLLETSGRNVGAARLAWIYLSRPFVLLVRHRALLLALLRGRPGARAQLRLARSGARLEAWLSGADP